MSVKKAAYEETLELLVATGDTYPEVLEPIKAYVQELHDMIHRGHVTTPVKNVAPVKKVAKKVKR